MQAIKSYCIRANSHTKFGRVVQVRHSAKLSSRRISVPGSSAVRVTSSAERYSKPYLILFVATITEIAQRVSGLRNLADDFQARAISHSGHGRWYHKSQYRMAVTLGVMGLMPLGDRAATGLYVLFIVMPFVYKYDGSLISCFSSIYIKLEKSASFSHCSTRAAHGFE